MIVNTVTEAKAKLHPRILFRLAFRVLLHRNPKNTTMSLIDPSPQEDIEHRCDGLRQFLDVYE